MELTRQQLQRQDLVDNLILELLNQLSPTPLQHDIGLVSSVREAIQAEFAARGIMQEQDFYPWIEEDE